MKKVHLTNFNIAGFGYWEGCEVLEELHIGTRLELVREKDNQFDPYAVAIFLESIGTSEYFTVPQHFQEIIHVDEFDFSGWPCDRVKRDEDQPTIRMFLLEGF